MRTFLFFDFEYLILAEKLILEQSPKNLLTRKGKRDIIDILKI